MRRCERCGENPAAVFMPGHAVCRQCWRDIQADEMIDGEIPNAETCSTCGDLLVNGSCDTPHWRRLRRAA